MVIVLVGYWLEMVIIKIINHYLITKNLLLMAIQLKLVVILLVPLLAIKLLLVLMN